MNLIATVVAAALVGWCLGYLSAWATDWLQRQDELPLAHHGPLIRDVLVQAGSAAVWAVSPLLLEGEWWRWAAAATLAVPLIQVAVTDLRHRYVYSIIAGAGLVLGVALGWIVHQDAWWLSLIGAAGAGLVFTLIWGAGKLLYRGQEPLARGDITIAAMVGATAGACTVSAIFYGVLASGLFAIGVWAVKRSRNAYLPYGPGLCLGGLVTLFRC